MIRMLRGWGRSFCHILGPIVDPGRLCNYVGECLVHLFARDGGFYTEETGCVPLKKASSGHAVEVLENVLDKSLTRSRGSPGDGLI